MWTSNANFDTTCPFNSAWPTIINRDSIPAASQSFQDLGPFSKSCDLSCPPYGRNVEDFIGWNDSLPSTSNDFLAGFSSSATNLLSTSFTLDFATLILPIISRMFSQAAPSALMIFIAGSSVSESVIRNVSHPSSLRLIREQSIDHQLIYMIFHQLVNNGDVVQALDEPKTKLDHFFKLGIEYCFSLREDLLRSIISLTPAPYNLALIHNIFCAALILGNGPVLKVILDMDPVGLADRPILLAGFCQCPLDFAVGRGHLQTTQALLDHGVELGRLKTQYLLRNAGRMKLIQQQNDEARVEIMRLLINHGVEFDRTFAVSNMDTCEKSELLLVVTHFLDKSFGTFFRAFGLPRILSRVDWNSSLSTTLEAILDRAFLDGIDHQDLWNSVLSESLSFAVLRNHTSAVSILLARDAQPDTRCLISAVQSHSLEIFEDFLNRGLDPNAIVPNRLGTFGTQDMWECTALSESIKDPSRGAFRVLKARGFISKLAQQPAGFVPALIEACRVGDSLLVEELLSLQTRPGRKAKIGTALEVAIEGTQHHITKMLLFAGIKPTTRCYNLAIQKRQLAIIKLLISYMELSDVSSQSHNALDVILFEALRWGDRTTIEHVLRMKHPVNVFSVIPYSKFQDWNVPPDLRPPGKHPGWSLTPLSAAILKDNLTAVEALLAYGAHVALFSVKPEGYNSISYASDVCALTPLAACVVRHDLCLLKELLRIGADPFDNVALYVCAVLDLEDITKLLLSAFRNRFPNGAQSFGSMALCHTIRHDRTRLLLLLAEHTDLTGRVKEDVGSDPDIPLPRPLNPRRYAHPPPPPPLPPPSPPRPLSGNNYTSPLGEAIRLHSACGSTDGVLDFILPLVKDLNAVVRRNYKHGNMTCLLYAIALNSLRTVQKLHLAGANISLPAEWGIPRTPLQAAAQAGSMDIVKYLLGEDISPNEPPAPQAGATSLQLAAITGNIGIAAILLDAGAKINAKPALFNGRTAFEGATEHGRIEMMLFLAHHGADLLANNNEQYRCAVEYAEDNLQYAAKALADELFAKAMANRETRITASGTSGWTGFDMTDFEEYFPQEKKV